MKDMDIVAELTSLVEKAKFGDKQAILTLLSGAVLFVTFIYILLSLIFSKSSKKKAKSESGTVMKVEEGVEVRRSTRTPKAPKRWVPDSPAAAAAQPASATKAPVANGTPAAVGETKTPRQLRSRAGRA